MTEGTGHVIDPAGDARRALQEAVTAQGPAALSDATVMENLCRTQLTALPGECILIVSAARADVPALLRDNIPQLGTYGAIQSVATTLANAHDLDNAASLWVVREFARALGLIASGGTAVPVPRRRGGSRSDGRDGRACGERWWHWGTGKLGEYRGARECREAPGYQEAREWQGAQEVQGAHGVRSPGWQGVRRGWRARGRLRRGGRPGPSCSTATRSGSPRRSRWSRGTWGSRRRRT